MERAVVKNGGPLCPIQPAFTSMRRVRLRTCRLLRISMSSTPFLRRACTLSASTS